MAKKEKQKFIGLNAKALGLSLGLLWGFGVFLVTLISIFTGYLSEFLTLLEGVYPFYKASINGSLSGLVFGFVDGFIGGYLIAWIYNKFNKK